MIGDRIVEIQGIVVVEIVFVEVDVVVQPADDACFPSDCHEARKGKKERLVPEEDLDRLLLFTS